MIRSESVDVEITPNMFSITFIDIRSYNETFSDCIDEDKKPIPITDKLSVKEILNRLDKVKCKQFVITDTDDSQLLEMVSYLNSMQPYYETKVSDSGEIYQVGVRTDLFGYNNSGYDDYIIGAFLMKFNHFEKTKYLITYLYELSKKVIDLQKQDKSVFYEDKEIQLVRSYKLPYTTVDVQKIYGLHAVATISKDGQKLKFPKGLKQTAINLKWHEILEFKLPPIDEEEKELYWDKIEGNYKYMTLDQLNDLDIKDFDRYILPKYIPKMMYYNKNDVFIVCEMARQKPDEIKLRYSISSSYKIPVYCSARANIADKLTVKFYSEMSGLDKSRFVKERTQRTALSFKKVIFPHIKFKTKQLQDLLEDMKQVIIYHTDKDSFKREINFYGTTYTIATGGIHTQDLPKVYTSNDKYVYLHHD